MGDGLGGDVETSAGSPSPPQSLQLRPGHSHLRVASSSSSSDDDVGGLEYLGVQKVANSATLLGNGACFLNMKSTGITIGQGQVIKLTIHFLITYRIVLCYVY